MGQWFAKLSEVQWYTWLVIIALVALGALLLASGRKTKWDSRKIAYASMVIAISFVLSYIRLWRMPQGGSITLLSMLPVIAYAVAVGPIEGFVVGCAYGLLQLLQDMFVIHPMQMLLDYPLGFGALALGGLAVLMPVGRKWKLPVAVLLGCAGRLLMSTLSGVVFFSEYAEGSGHGPLLYSLIYNGSYIGAEALIMIAVALIPGVDRIVDVLKGRQLQRM